MSIKHLVLGGSRGLGASLVSLLGDEAVSYSRSQKPSLDLSKGESLKHLKKIIEEKPNLKTIYYCAGGGPHGDFFSKPLHSHIWAYDVNFKRPIELAYHLIDIKYNGQYVYIGSAIAERSNSLMSLSYSQSKKMALKNLLSLKEDKLKVRVFSPPYMNTGLLPPKAWPRLEASNLVLEPEDVAKTLINWLNNEVGQSGGSDPRHFDWIDRFSYSLPEGKEF